MKKGQRHDEAKIDTKIQGDKKINCVNRGSNFTCKYRKGEGGQNNPLACSLK